jgi:hypothetical protein
MTACKHCGHPVRPDDRVGPLRAPTGWTHRGTPAVVAHWRGQLCPGGATVAEPVCPNPTCPCQDGLVCHYVDTPTTRALPLPSL